MVDAILKIEHVLAWMASSAVILPLLATPALLLWLHVHRARATR
jgi:hypothetical protein